MPCHFQIDQILHAASAKKWLRNFDELDEELSARDIIYQIVIPISMTASFFPLFEEGVMI